MFRRWVGLFCLGFEHLGGVGFGVSAFRFVGAGRGVWGPRILFGLLNIFRV